MGSEDLSLLDVLNGVSPDYSVVAQKTADRELLIETSAPFNVEYGLTLDFLATQYSGQQKSVRHEESMLKLQEALEQNSILVKHKLWQEGEYQKLESQSLFQQKELDRLGSDIKALHEKYAQREIYISSLHSKHSNLEAELLNLQNQLREADQRHEEAATSLDVIVDAHANQLNQIYTSTSWRIMGPIRRLKRLFSAVPEQLQSSDPEQLPDAEAETDEVVSEEENFEELERLSPQGKKILQALKEATNKE